VVTTKLSPSCSSAALGGPRLGTVPRHSPRGAEQSGVTTPPPSWDTAGRSQVLCSRAAPQAAGPSRPWHKGFSLLRAPASIQVYLPTDCEI